MNAQTPVTYGPPRCDSKGLCEPQTSPPPGVTTTVPHVIVDNDGFYGRPQISVDADSTVRAIHQLNSTIQHGITAFVVFAVVLLYVLMRGLATFRSDTPSEP